MWDKIPLDNKTIIKRNEEKNMKKKMIQTLVAIPFALTAFAFTTQANAQETVDMHRLYNPNSGEHFYTADSAEKAHLVSVGWKYEGVGWLAPKKDNASPVYRVYNPNAGDHHYTLDSKEMFALVDLGWKYEGIGWYSDEQKGVKLYRAYNPNAKSGAHNYTTNLGEQKNLLKVGWKDEGTAWYGVDPNKKDEPVTQPKDNGGTVTPPKDNSGNQNQGGQTTPPTNSGDSGNVTPPTDNGGNGSGQVTPDPKPQPSEELDDRVIGQEVLRLLNIDREKIGVKPLAWNEDMYQCAKVRAQELKEQFSHLRPNGKWAESVIEDNRELSKKYVFGGENISKCFKFQTNKEIADMLYSQWSASQSHHQNMMNPDIEFFGFSVSFSKDNIGELALGVQYFGKYSSLYKYLNGLA